MSGAASTAEPGGRWERLPERLRPRTHERRGRGDLRRVESTLLVLAFLLLAVAVVNDVVRQVHVNERITADLRTWRTITGNDLINISVEQDLTHHTTRDVLCGNTGEGPPGTQPQACLIVTGPRCTECARRRAASTCRPTSRTSTSTAMPASEQR